MTREAGSERRSGWRRLVGPSPRGYAERLGRWEAWCVGLYWPIMVLAWLRIVPGGPFWVVLLPLLWRPITDAVRAAAARPWRTLGAGMLVLAVLVAVPVVLVEGIFEPSVASSAGVDLTNLNTSGAMEELRAHPWMYVLFALVGPFEEEMTYRYGLFRLLSRVNLTLAHVGTGLVFGLQHVVVGWLAGHPEQLLLLPGFVVFSLVLSIAYRRTGNILVPVVAHALSNGIPLAFVLLAG